FILTGNNLILTRLRAGYGIANSAVWSPRTRLPGHLAPLRTGRVRYGQMKSKRRDQRTEADFGGAWAVSDPRFGRGTTKRMPGPPRPELSKRNPSKSALCYKCIVKLFISWSGGRSKRIALVFRQWLPTVIQGLKPWMSDVDLQKGADWNQTLTSELEATSFGLFCLTPENLSSPWLLFEAGAIARRPGLKRVFTHLFDLADNDVPWPLAQFQSTKSTRDDL